MDKIIITVVGKDKVGIIARVCMYLSENGINILDISQTITGGYFNMLVIADVTNCKKSYEMISADLENIGRDMELIITAQREGIFTAMHRI